MDYDSNLVFTAKFFNQIKSGTFYPSAYRLKGITKHADNHKKKFTNSDFGCYFYSPIDRTLRTTPLNLRSLDLNQFLAQIPGFS